ncbi:TPA: beta-glucoside-specific PTS transporter subunit IIABC [Streptococcus suis]
MDYSVLARSIVDKIGGKPNISHMEHCSTRLRFTLYDNDKADIQAIEALEGVMGVRQTGQTQIIIGNEVNEVYKEVEKYVGALDNQSQAGKPANQGGFGAKLLDFLTGVFQPLVPAIAGGGVLKSLLLLFSLLGWLSKDGSTYKVLTMIGDAPLYFLPLLVAISTANKLKVNPMVAVSAVGALLLPNMTTLISEGGTLFNFGIQNIAYAYQVFPAILTVLLYAQVEKFLTKVTPKPIRIFFVPMVALVITVPIALLILGPLGFNFGQIFAKVIVAVYEKLGWIATGLLAAVLPFMVATGMHKAMLPYAIATMTELGKEILYLPASLAHNIAESGATFAVALKTKDEKLRATSLSAGISALFGITEPALYGVTLQHKSVLYSVISGSLVGGIFIGLVGIEAFALVGPGLASMTMYTNPDNPNNLIMAFVAFAISFVVAFAAAFILYKDTPVTQEEDVAAKKSQVGLTTSPNLESEQVKNIVLNAPLKGELIALDKVNDDVFASKMLGDGFAIIPEEEVLHAPASGVVSMVYETKHALGLTLDNGASLLFHLGIDTVRLGGQHFEALVKEGDRVNVGQALLAFDLKAIKAAGYDPTIMVVVTNPQSYEFNYLQTKSQLDKNSPILELFVS